MFPMLRKSASLPTFPKKFVSIKDCFNRSMGGSKGIKWIYGGGLNNSSLVFGSHQTLQRSTLYLKKSVTPPITDIELIHLGRPMPCFHTNYTQ